MYTYAKTARTTKTSVTTFSLVATSCKDSSKPLSRAGFKDFRLTWVRVFIFWWVTPGTTAVTFHDSFAAPTVHSGFNPRWLRPCRSAEEVPLRRNSRNYLRFPRRPSLGADYQGRWYVEGVHASPVIDKCGRRYVWLWQTVRVKMGLACSPFP